MPDDLSVTPPVTVPGEGVSTPPPETPQPEGNLNWLLSLPEDLQNDNLLTNFKSVEDLARGYSNTKRWADGRVKLPDDNTSPDEVNQFYSRLGVPEKPEDYQFTKVEISPAVGVDPAQIETFKPIFHKLKLTKAQADGIQSEYLKSIADQHNKLVAEYTAEMNQKVDVLKSRWGDQYDTKIDAAKRYFNNAAPPAVQVYVEKNGLGNDADFIEWMYNQSVATSEDSLRGGSPVETKTLDQEIKSVEAKLYNLPVTDPEYKGLVKKRDELYTMRYPQSE